MLRINAAAEEAQRRLHARVPEIASYETTTVLLNPRPGEPGSHDAHLGGPLLWPADEEWPRCEKHPGDDYPYHLVAVAQLPAADFPGLPYPEGTDLIQVLWCPVYHHQPHPEGWGPAARVVFRRAADVTSELAGQPDGWAEWHDDFEAIVPRPCVLHPEPLPELPPWDALPADIRDRLEVTGTTGEFALFSSLGGCKAGGAMDWTANARPSPLTCPACEAPYTLLLQVDSGEFLPSDGPAYGPSTFAPPAESDLAPLSDAWLQAAHPTQMSIGRSNGHGGLFVCTSAPAAHPPSFFSA